MDLGCLHWMEGETPQKRYFAVSCGIGYDAAVCQEALDSPIKDRLNRIGLGKLSYLGIGLKQMLTLRFQKASVRLDGIEVVHASKPSVHHLNAVQPDQRLVNRSVSICLSRSEMKAFRAQMRFDLYL